MLSSLPLPYAFLLPIGLLLLPTQGFIRLDMSEFQERHEVSESSVKLGLEGLSTGLPGYFDIACDLGWR